MGNSTDVVFCLQAYMNPFARWLDHGRFQCNFCGATSECPREYMCNLGADGRRMDWAQRPELCRGSVEYAAPGELLFTFRMGKLTDAVFCVTAEYMVRPPMAPALMFCIDVSLAAVQVSVVKQSPSHTQIPNHHPITDRSLSIRAVGRDDVGGGGHRANAGLGPRTQTHARGYLHVRQRDSFLPHARRDGDAADVGGARR